MNDEKDCSGAKDTSDCDMQGKARCNARRCYDLGCFGLCGDETTKSEGQPDRDCSDTSRSTCEPERRPSDCTADVTEEELAERIYNAVPAHTASSGRKIPWKELTSLTGYPYPTIVDGHRKEARALLDAFTVGRR